MIAFFPAAVIEMRLERPREEDSEVSFEPKLFAISSNRQRLAYGACICHGTKVCSDTAGGPRGIEGGWLTRNGRSHRAVSFWLHVIWGFFLVEPRKMRHSV